MLTWIVGWASWSVSDHGRYHRASSANYESADANDGIVGNIPVHAVRRVAPEARDAHHKGQITEHGFLVE
jgi:hypothetical protein